MYPNVRIPCNENKASQEEGQANSPILIDVLPRSEVYIFLRFAKYVIALLSCITLVYKILFFSQSLRQHRMVYCFMQ